MYGSAYRTPMHSNRPTYRTFWGISSFEVLAWFRRGLFYSFLSIYLRHLFSELGDCGHADCRSDYRHDDCIRGAWGIILSRILYGSRRYDLDGNTHYDGACFLYPKETVEDLINSKNDGIFYHIRCWLYCLCFLGPRSLLKRKARKEIHRSPLRLRFKRAAQNRLRSLFRAGPNTPTKVIGVELPDIKRIIVAVRQRFSKIDSDISKW